MVLQSGHATDASTLDHCPELGTCRYVVTGEHLGSVCEVSSTQSPRRTLNATHQFASDIVDEVACWVPYSRSELIHAATRLSHWSALQGRALDRGSVFTDANINAFVEVALADSPDSTRGNRRAQLRRIREVLDGESSRRIALKASDPLAPYSARDLANLRRWADRQAKPEFVSDAWAMLALGLGAGLSAGEIGDVQLSDVRVDGGGVQILVHSRRVRTVPVRREWEETLETAVKGKLTNEDAYLIRSKRKTNPRNLVSNIVDRGEAPERGPQSQRMRTTWLVRHLTENVPVNVLVDAAGLQGLDGLTRYLRFLPAHKPGTVRAALRG